MRSGAAESLIIIVVSFLIFSCKKEGSNNNVAVEAIPYHPLNSEKVLDIIMQQIGNARIVLLGEASHGLAEYYDWRAALSKRLIKEKGFDFIE